MPQWVQTVTTHKHIFKNLPSQKLSIPVTIFYTGHNFKITMCYSWCALIRNRGHYLPVFYLLQAWLSINVQQLRHIVSYDTKQQCNEHYW